MAKLQQMAVMDKFSSSENGQLSITTCSTNSSGMTEDINSYSHVQCDRRACMGRN